MSYRVLIRFLLPFLLSACASNMTADERAYKRAETVERWQLCQKIYRDNSMIWVSRFHSGRHRMPSMFDIQDDLRQNRCGLILRHVY